LISHKKLVE